MSIIGRGGVKNWSKFLTDRILKNCRHGGGECKKSGKMANVVYEWSQSTYFYLELLEKHLTAAKQ